MLCRLSFFVLALSVITSYAQKTTDHRKEALSLIKKLLQEHAQPKAVDDRFSSYVFNEFLEALDPDKLYFTEPDIQGLLPFKTKLDDELNGNGWAFLQAVLPVYKSSLERAEKIINKHLDSPITGNVMEYYSYDTSRWTVSDQELSNKWRMWLKYETLDRLSEMYTTNAAKDFFIKYEPDARARVKSIEVRYIRRILNHPAGFENYVLSQYLKSIAAVFDPHSTYLSTNDMQNFLSSLSTEGYYFGVGLNENERGDVVISSLAPGGPAWKSGELQKSDILLNLKWEGQKEIDVAGISLEEATGILSDAGHKIMEFTVRNSSGVVHSVKLQKENLSLEENFVHSFLLSGEKKVGYISLPDFYTQWGDESEGSKCANDVAKEIIKLKKENIQGLVLDIRGNGGGSMQEAVALAGIFIDEGSMGILKNNKQELTVLKDMNRGTVYDGPLIVMVNGQSASASEFLAAVLQDYRRALIVGSRTYGKATFQNFFPLNALQKEPTMNNIKDGSGFASITGGKFYRVTGKSAQGKGVIPDVHMPDVLEGLLPYESDMPFVLPTDSVVKRTYYKQLSGVPTGELAKKSTIRQNTSQAFKRVNQSRELFRQILNERNESISLIWTDFNKKIQERMIESASWQQAFTNDKGSYDVINMDADQQRLKIDEYAMELNRRWINTLIKDPYVEEAFSIMSDIINLNIK